MRCERLAPDAARPRPANAVTGSRRAGRKPGRVAAEASASGQLFLDAGGLAAALAEVVQLGLTHVTATLDADGVDRSEEHTFELQSRPHLVCRLLLEKKKKKIQQSIIYTYNMQ